MDAAQNINKDAKLINLLLLLSYIVNSCTFYFVRGNHIVLSRVNASGGEWVAKFKTLFT